MLDALVDDQVTDFGQAIDIRFARTEIAAFDRVVEQTVNAVAVVLIIFGGVDSALRGDGVRAARRILKAKTFHAIAELAERGRGRSAGESAADDNDLKFSAIVRTDEPRMIAMALPFLGERAGRNSGVERADHSCCAGLISPSKIATGIEA